MTKKTHGLEVENLTQAGPMSFLKILIPETDHLLGNAQGAIYLRWEPQTGELNIEIADFREPLKGSIDLISYTKSDLVIRVGGLEK